jgi:hypothetical protein
MQPHPFIFQKKKENPKGITKYACQNKQLSSNWRHGTGKRGIEAIVITAASRN